MKKQQEAGISYQSHKNAKTMSNKITKKRGESLTTLADKYYEKYSLRHKQRRFKEELERKFGHHLSLKTRIKRKGWYRGKRLPNVVINIIAERLGEP